MPNPAGAETSVRVALDTAPSSSSSRGGRQRGRAGAARAAWSPPAGRASALPLSASGRARPSVRPRTLGRHALASASRHRSGLRIRQRCGLAAELGDAARWTRRRWRARHRRIAQPEPPERGHPGRSCALYTLSYTGGRLLFLAPLLVSLALKVNDLVGIDDAPRNLGARDRGRIAGGDREQPALRPAERPNHRTDGHAAAVDGHRAGRRHDRNPDGRARAEHRGRAARVVHRAGVLQRTPRRPDGRAARPGARAQRGWSPGCSACACRWPPWPAPTSSRRSTDTELTMFLAPCVVGGVFVVCSRRR